MSDQPAGEERKRDKPWIFRTYAGHSTASESNALYRRNLARGQTGLSVAFDLPTQTGYDPDHELARGEVGKVGVSIAHLGDMRTLFEGIPLKTMNTSMTINATAPWLLALYVAAAEEQGAPRHALQGTTQNDIIKEYLSRGTYVFPPAPSLQLTRDVILFTTSELPKWNPMNVCSYHLQEAGATPVQELSFALATAIAVLDTVRATGVDDDTFAEVVGRISFFVNAGMRFITELCKMRAFAELWDEIARERYRVADPKKRVFRYGVQVNSLGLTEQQPENNVHRIMIEMLAVTLSKKARARAVQLPAWNEALGLPRSWDQQWSLRMQQILAFETDLLENEDIFDGSRVIESKVAALKEEVRSELRRLEGLGGAVAGVESGYLKRALVESNARRLAAIESGEQIVVGVNRYTEGEPSPLTAGDGAILTVPETVEMESVHRIRAWRSGRDAGAAQAALDALEAAAREGRSIMPASIACAKAGVTTGEWGETLRRVFGEYRAPTGVTPRPRVRGHGGDPAHGHGTLRDARRDAAPRRRQARPRRPLERSRADRAPGSGRRHGGRLRRNSPDAGGDRRQGARGESARGRLVDPLRLARAPGARGEGAPAARRAGPRAAGRRRHHLPRGRARPQEHGRRGRLHPEGLCPRRRHGRHGARRRPGVAARARRARPAAAKRRAPIPPRPGGLKAFTSSGAALS